MVTDRRSVAVILGSELRFILPRLQLAGRPLEEPGFGMKVVRPGGSETTVTDTDGAVGEICTEVAVTSRNAGSNSGCRDRTRTR